MPEQWAVLEHQDPAHGTGWNLLQRLRQKILDAGDTSSNYPRTTRSTRCFACEWGPTDYVKKSPYSANGSSLERIRAPAAGQDDDRVRRGGHHRGNQDQWSAGQPDGCDPPRPPRSAGRATRFLSRSPSSLTCCRRSPSGPGFSSRAATSSMETGRPIDDQVYVDDREPSPATSSGLRKKIADGGTRNSRRIENAVRHRVPVTT